jgi:ubiquinone/menaquinone biosynthesis C-methylase UbiE
MASDYVTDTVKEHRTVEYNDNLEIFLKQAGQIFDIPRIISEPQEKPQIINYYETTKFLTYRVFNSWEGFLHFGISYDGKHKKGDFKEQARIVERHIGDSNAKNVLELAYGLGANSAFLASRNPDVTFDGVDLSLTPLKRYAKMPNVNFQLGDYHDLSTLEDDTYDIVFVIEALCHSTNKLQVLREVKKKLKRDGLFIVIDGYRSDRATPLSQSEDIMMRLIEKSLSVDKIECIKDVEGYMREEYSIAEAQDVTQCVLPSMNRLGSLSITRFYFAHPHGARLVNKILPFDDVKNLMAVSLLPISIRRQLFCYYIHVLKNDT